MSEARALLEQAFEDAGWHEHQVEKHIPRILATPSAAELIRRADRPEARVAVEGLTVEMLERVRQAYLDYSPEMDKGVNAVVDAVIAILPAPRPPEPDRTAALDEERLANALRVAVDADRHTELVYSGVVSV
jgi:hypothetical protein